MTEIEEDPFVDALAETAFLTVGVLTRVGAAYDLSLPQLRLLGILRNRRRRMSALADHLGLDRSSTTGLVDRAERRGLVRREPAADDRRAVEALLTEAGAALTDRVAGEVREALTAATGHLSVAERQRLTGLLRRLVGPPPGRPPGPAPRAGAG